jgi:NAD(P)-dependent dehydrogenase (short-subunit alcohol dehydrogenase family)
MSDKVALVTGASSGIGKATALQLAAHGYHVFAAARRLEQLESIRVVNLEPLYLDIASEASIKTALEKVLAHSGRLDVLVNNAGFAVYRSLEDTSIEEARQQFEVNLFGLMQLTQQVLPIMRRQAAGSIVNVSSVTGKFGAPMAGWYSATKHALEALSDTLRMELKPFGIKVILVQPGAISTEFVEQAFQKAEQAPKSETYGSLLNAHRNLLQSAYRYAADPYVVARAIQQAVSAKQPKARYPVPGHARLILLAKTLISDRLFDRLFLRQLRWR